MHSPLHRLSMDSRYLLFIVSLGSLLILGWRMGRIQKDPTSDLPRVSQMSLEFAVNPEEVDFLKKTAWDVDGTERARRLIYWDFGFLVFYALLLSLGCMFAADGRFRQARFTRTLGLLLAWGSLIAAVADIGANLAMLCMLGQKTVTSLALSTAKTFAYIEFSLIGLALIYMIAAMILALLDQAPVHSADGHPRFPSGVE